MTDPKAAWPFPSSDRRDVDDYAYPKCYRCGHNYFDRKPVPKVNGLPADGGLCDWCQEEVHEGGEERDNG